MANFLFNSARVGMATSPNTFDWLADQIVGILYDTRLVVTPAMVWDDVSSYVVATSGLMGSREVTADGRLRGDTLEFKDVTTQPGLKIKGLILKFQVSNELICNYQDGLDGFTSNPDLNLEATDLDIYARTSASQGGAWIAL